MSNCIVKMGTFHKDPQGALLIEGQFETPRKLWEPRFDNGYPNVIYDPQAKLYRLYYTLFVKDDHSLNTTPEARKKGPYVIKGRKTGLAYAESKDGIHWTKPNLGLVEFEGSKDNNLILRDVQGTGVLYDAKERDPSRRYKLITLQEIKGKANLCVAFSADGIHFSELQVWPQESKSPVPGGDCHNSVFIDPRTNEYVLITRLWDNNIRVSAISRSKDFYHWTPPKELHRGRGFFDQVYSMPVFQYEGIYLGLASIFRDGDNSLKQQDNVDLELHWTTTLDRFIPCAPDDDSTFIPHGSEGKGYPDGEFDSNVIFSALPLEQDNKLVFYYMGGKGKHTGWRETALGRGYIEKDKFAYYTARDPAKPCVITTQGLNFPQKKVRLLLELNAGESCQVALLDRNGKVQQEGFEADKSVLSKSADGWYELSWQNAPYDKLDSSKFYALQITLNGGKLWAIADAYPRPLKYTRHI
ncbi:hypothetical protein L5B71_03325 [Avibacterium sp. 21-586]|uniref:hypothetical protein n=1 Tax=Avibacterium sp. 21-586 TaxID=2911534 RepID=UPI002248371B|nr:hypothetical protein [Avibacterium sp. 21-586]MCW9709923.1 hypothetical protein [Avibacterium sp. 21-586]